jgi:hypothetical protein
MYEGNERAEDFDFLQAYGWDNAYWCQKPLIEDGLAITDYHKWDSDTRFDYFITRSDYGRVLNSLPENKRKAELLGSMEVFEGMFFGDFRYTKHIIDYQRKLSFSTVAGLDYGNTTVLEVLQMDYEGNVVVSDELYLSDLESPSERANTLADFLLEKKLNNLLIIYDTDMEISQLSNVGFDKTPIQIFRHILKLRMDTNAPSMIVVNKTSLDNNKSYRQICNQATKEYLHIDKVSGQPRLFFSKNVKYLVKEMTETIIYDPNDPSGADFLNRGTNKPHAFDSFKYALMQLYKPKLQISLKPVIPRQQAVKLSKQKTISSF